MRRAVEWSMSVFLSHFPMFDRFFFLAMRVAIKQFFRCCCTICGVWS